MAKRDVSFFTGIDERTSPEARRRDAMAEMLARSAQPTPNEVIGGYVVPKSGTENLAKGLSMALSGYQAGQAERAEKERRDAARTTMASAMEAYNRSQIGGPEQLASGETINWNAQDPRNAGRMYANLLMQNEDTAPMGIQTQMGHMQTQMDMANQLMMEREKASIRNQMTPYQAAMLELKKQGGAAQIEITTDPVTGEIMEVPVMNEYGVPAVPMKSGFINDPKQEAMFKRMTATAAQKRLQGEDMTNAAEKARKNLTNAKRFEELMGQQKTGGALLNIPIVGGMMETFDPELAEMKSIQDKLTPGQREPGSGATSDFDARMFQSALFGTKKPGATNQSIVAGMKAQAQQDIEYQNFMSDYFQQNNHLDGADAYWKDYVENNPIFDPASPAAPKVNANRKSYREYFGAQPAMDAGQRGGGQSLSFNTPEEAEAANLPPGTIVIINGRKAVVE